MGLPDWDEEHAKYAHDLLFSSDALLLGRRTYEEEVARLKEQPGQHILKYGSGDLDRTLIQNNLIGFSSAGSTTLGRVNPPPSRAWDGVTGDS